MRTVSCGNWTHFSCVFTFQKSSDCVASCEDPCSQRRIDITQVKGACTFKLSEHKQDVGFRVEDEQGVGSISCGNWTQLFSLLAGVPPDGRLKIDPTNLPS